MLSRDTIEISKLKISSPWSRWSFLLVASVFVYLFICVFVYLRLCVFAHLSPWIRWSCLVLAWWELKYSNEQLIQCSKYILLLCCTTQYPSAKQLNNSNPIFLWKFRLFGKFITLPKLKMTLPAKTKYEKSYHSSWQASRIYQNAWSGI